MQVIPFDFGQRRYLLALGFVERSFLLRLVEWQSYYTAGSDRAGGCLVLRIKQVSILNDIPEYVILNETRKGFSFNKRSTMLYARLFGMRCWYVSHRSDTLKYSSIYMYVRYSAVSLLPSQSKSLLKVYTETRMISFPGMYAEIGRITQCCSSVLLTYSILCLMPWIFIFGY